MKQVLFFALLLNSIISFGQVDTEFWFVAPEVTSKHGDSPLYFRITTLDKAANVTIKMPASSSFSDISFTLPAKTQVYKEVPKKQVENAPANRVLSKGIQIISDEDITVYYEVANGVNPDKFTLKGSNALGTRFFIPGQNIYKNWHEYTNPIADEKADIVATEDNTVIEITPRVDITGHKANETYSITLHKGQTYSIENRNMSRTSTLAGTEVTSNKPIAITVSDDSINQGHPVTERDLIGDQIVSTDVIGMHYIAGKTSDTPYTLHKIFVTATEDNTHIYLADDINQMSTLNKGETKDFDIVEDGLYIKANHPIYAYHVTGLFNTYGNEIGSALLPNANCTGSKSVTFTRTMAKRLYVQMCTQKRNKDSFTLYDADGNNRNDLISGLQWHKVTGTDNGPDPDKTWYTACVQLGWENNNNGIGTGEAYTMTNSNGLFHLSILDENNGSMSYGYFSSYKNTTIKGYNLACVGQAIELEVTKTNDRYEWFSDVYGDMVIGRTKSIQVKKSGKYWVNTENFDEGCMQTDTINVDFVQPEIDLGDDILACPQEIISIGVNDIFDKYQWNDGHTGKHRTLVITPGMNDVYDLTITDSEGCTNSDTIVVQAKKVPVLELTNKTDFCQNEKLYCLTEMDHYIWFINNVIQPNYTENWIDVKRSGTYTCRAWDDDECEGEVSVNLTMHLPPNIALTDIIECDGSIHRFDFPGYSKYIWQDGSENSYFEAKEPGPISLHVTDQYGCESTVEAKYEWYEKNELPSLIDATVCEETGYVLSTKEGFASYTWYRDGQEISELKNKTSYSIEKTRKEHEGEYKLDVVDNNGCELSSTMKLKVEDEIKIDLGEDTDLCEGDQIIIKEGKNDFSKYEWFFTPTGGTEQKLPYHSNYILAENAGTYKLIATMSEFCKDDDDVVIGVKKKPELKLSDDFDICPDNTKPHTLRHTSFKFEDGSNATPADYTWSTGATTETINITKPGTYNLILKASNECSDTASIEIREYEKLEFDLEDVSICEGLTTTLQRPASLNGKYDSYDWSLNGQVLASDKDLIASKQGTYVLSVTDKNNCLFNKSLQLNLLEAPKFTLGPDQRKCPGEIFTIGIQDDFKKYMWNDDVNDKKSYKETTEPGEYKLTVWNKNKCSSSDTIVLSHHKPQKPNIGPDHKMCSGIQATLTVPEGFTDYRWNTESREKQITVDNGKYILYAKDSHECQSSDTVLVTWYPIPKVALGPDTIICPVNQITLAVAEKFPSLLWHNGSHENSIIADIDVINKVTVTDINGCVGWDTKMVTPIPTEDVELIDNQQVCSIDTVTLDAGEEYIAYKWNTGDETRKLKIIEPGQYIVEVTDGCHIYTDTADIVYYPTPIFSVIDTSLVGQVKVLATGGTAPYQYKLNDESWKEKGVFEIGSNGVYTITTEDVNGCQAIEELEFNYIVDIDIPKLVTPNGDGYNDRFTIDGIEKFPNSIIRIYDRYGKQLIEYLASDPGWDGRYLGKPVKSDAYWYVIELKPLKGFFKGHITLKR